jgi:DNA repair protein RadA/Sms
MPKTIKPALYVCSSCEVSLESWSGRCPRCGEWNTLEVVTNTNSASSGIRLKLNNLQSNIVEDERRFPCGIPAIDKLLGGGVVAGSITLLSGDPGIGKSTLLLQIAGESSTTKDVLYVSGEESVHQIALRAKRLGVRNDRLSVASTNSADQIAAEILSGRHGFVIVDSIQTIALDEVGSSAGSVAQVTNSSALLTQAAKQSNCAVIVVGHVTKEGNVAGPKLLEHIVDVVMSLEGDSSAGLKLLRVSKNRFGPTNETAIFEMFATGLHSVANPSALLLAERKATDGSVVLAAMEGSRPLLVEIQALVNPTSYGYPKRAASGFDLSRLNLLLAMIERRTTLKLGDKDVYLNLVGGLKINEPAADLAVVMAVASAARAKKLNHNAVVFGEVGLSGEIRSVPFVARRISEAKQLGFDFAIGPKSLKDKQSAFLIPALDVKSALNNFLG